LSTKKQSIKMADQPSPTQLNPHGSFFFTTASPANHGAPAPIPASAPLEPDQLTQRLALATLPHPYTGSKFSKVTATSKDQLPALANLRGPRLRS
ncbi:hypothetical protein PSHT_13044, partial [Puccinia striiformis]